ncbi:hypothetical protein BX600DRAFT_429860 [Xylariales sp. PMI_506]|nr:hypothetical protein BX600DRAFT_429860 [Xylariales sp. PMI_506]
MEKRNSPHSALYGQACMTCVKAKSRCISRPDSESCQRCYRLSKQCSPADPLRRRTPQKPPNPNERITQLEGKVDSLVSLLQSTSTSQESIGPIQRTIDEARLTTASQTLQGGVSETLQADTPISASLASAIGSSSTTMVIEDGI